MRFYMTMLAYFSSIITMAVGISGIQEAVYYTTWGSMVYGIGALVIGLALFVILTTEYIRTWKAKLRRIKAEKEALNVKVSTN